MDCQETVGGDTMEPGLKKHTAGLHVTKERTPNGKGKGKVTEYFSAASNQCIFEDLQPLKLVNVDKATNGPRPVMKDVTNVAVSKVPKVHVNLGGVGEVNGPQLAGNQKENIEPTHKFNMPPRSGKSVIGSHSGRPPDKGSPSVESALDPSSGAAAHLHHGVEISTEKLDEAMEVEAGGDDGSSTATPVVQ